MLEGRNQQSPPLIEVLDSIAAQTIVLWRQVEGLSSPEFDPWRAQVKLLLADIARRIAREISASDEDVSTQHDDELVKLVG